MFQKSEVRNFARIVEIDKNANPLAPLRLENRAEQSSKAEGRECAGGFGRISGELHENVALVVRQLSWSAKRNFSDFSPAILKIIKVFHSIQNDSFQIDSNAYASVVQN